MKKLLTLPSDHSPWGPGRLMSPTNHGWLASHGELEHDALLAHELLDKLKEAVGIIKSEHGPESWPIECGICEFLQAVGPFLEVPE